MDFITQGIIGATVAQSVSNKKEIRQATVIGFLSGLAADADVLIRSSNDPMLVLEYHRHFTHSLIFIPFGALIVACVLWPFFKKNLSFKKLYFYCFAGNFLSGIIDACTSYGTHLFWPFMDERIAWHIISIIDPIFTLALLIGIIYALKTSTYIASRIAIAFCGCYLMLGYIQLQRAESYMFELAESRGHEIEQFMVKPTIGNIVLWRTIYLNDDKFYVDAIRAGVAIKVYIGASIDKFKFDTLPDEVNQTSQLYNDIKRFQFFSDNFVTWHPEKNNALGDVRYSMSPISVIPLWGIELDYTKQDQHVDYEFYRTIDKKKREEFMDMLFGKTII